MGFSNNRLKFTLKASASVVPCCLLLLWLVRSKLDNLNPTLSVSSYVYQSKPTKDFLVNTLTCKIPAMDPWRPPAHIYIHKKTAKRCPKPIIVAANRVLKFDEHHVAYKYSRCCVRQIHRVAQDPQNYNLSADWQIHITTHCVEIPKSTGMEFPSEHVRVICVTRKGKRTRKSYYHFGIPFSPENHSPETAKKSEFWAQKAADGEALPPSVLIIGLDSVSRLHFLRSMPQTHKFLQQNEFFELKGFTKIGDNTLPNAMALLGGMERWKYPCWRYNNSRKFDDCPLIWKNFSEQNYVTGHLEDVPGIAIFNQHKVGFVEQPTDYYLRPLAVSYHGKKLARHKGFRGCVGGMTQTDLMLKYVKEFVKVVNGTPYFLFTWFTSAAHDDLNALQALDKKFRDILQHVDTNGKNTMIVFMSDHGFRFGGFRESFMGYYEEALPFFFVRLPPSLKSSHSEWFSNLEVNQHRLTSHLDLHATFEDILSLSGATATTTRDSFKFTHSNWNSSASRDIFSLFEQVPSNRTCESAKIPADYCRCGIHPALSTKSELALKLAPALVKGINRIVSKTKTTRRLCHKLNLEKVLYFRQLNDGQIRTENGTILQFRDYLIALEASPGGPRFEAKTRYLMVSGTWKGMGEISRINKYGTAGDCLKTSNMKKYCVCRDSRVVNKSVDTS